MNKGGMQKWIVAAVVAVGLVPLAVLGLFMYVSATTVPLHPGAQAVASVGSASPVQPWSGAAEQARQIVRTAVAEQNLPGVSVAISVGDALVWAEGFGWANIENKVPVSPETRFRIGTASIPLTSAAVGLLIEQDRLKLDEQIQAYVPEFPAKQWPVTLHQLMAHTAGVRNDGGDEGPLFGAQCARPVDALQYFADRDLRFEPGTEYRYSSFGWVVVSAAVEAAADAPFLSFMRRQVFEPLGMAHTGADPAEPTPDVATPYFPRFAGDPRYGPDLMRPINLSCYAGASVFVSTPSDLVRFALAIRNGKLLRPVTVELLQSAQRLPSGKDTGYGLGWDVETVTLAGTQTRAIGHDGEVLGGITGSLMMLPEHGLIVSVLANTSYAETPAIAVRIAEMFAAAGRPSSK